MSLPAADELFRPTASNGSDEPAHPGEYDRAPAPSPADTAAADQAAQAARRPSGRVRHDEKMTVYITSDELMDLEHARLLLRRSHGLAVDRGRVVREAIAIALADFEVNGDDSVIVQRLRGA